MDIIGLPVVVFLLDSMIKVRSLGILYPKAGIFDPELKCFYFLGFCHLTPGSKVA